MVAQESTKELVEELKEGSTLLRNLSERFPDAAKSIKLVTCRELIETPQTQERDGQWERKGPPKMMVKETAANLFAVNEERIPIQANHSMIAKLSDGPGSAYHAVRDHMSIYANVAPATIERRHLKSECSSVLFDIIPLVSFVSDVACSVKSQYSETTRTKKSFENQVVMLEAFSRLLVDDELGKILEDPILSTKYPDMVIETLHKLKNLFSSYKDLMARFYEPYCDAIQGETSSAMICTKKNIDSVSATRALGEEMLQNPSINRKLFIQPTLTDILNKCKRLTDDLKEAMAFSMLCTIGDPEALRVLKSRESIRQMGLARTAQLQYLTRTARQPDMEGTSVPLDGHWTPNRQGSTDDLQLGRYFPDDDDKPVLDVLVEIRRYEPAPSLEDPKQASKLQRLGEQERLAKVKATMRGLAKLLEESSFEANEPPAEVDNTPRTISAFQCLGFLDNEENCQMDFLFKLPRGVSSAAVPGLKSLARYIETFAPPRKMSPMEQRFALARDLCQTALNLHECGWIHKSIRSRNIILVPHDRSDLATIEGPSSDEYHKFVLYLKGFEFSRPDDDTSLLKANYEPEINLYRHPERQNAPTEKFNKEHDIYAVGVVLLEIGLWKTVTSIYKTRIDGYWEDPRTMEPEMVKDELLKLARKYLPMEMGTKYSQAVQKCLSGGFGIGNDDKQRTKLALAFRHQVLDLIEAGSQL